jgi:hypothetical protein
MRRFKLPPLRDEPAEVASVGGMACAAAQLMPHAHALLFLLSTVAADMPELEGRRLSTAVWLKQHPYARPPPPSPPPLDSLNGEQLDEYLSDSGLAETKMASAGFDGAAVEELLPLPVLPA